MQAWWLYSLGVLLSVSAMLLSLNPGGLPLFWLMPWVLLLLLFSLTWVVTLLHRHAVRALWGSALVCVVSAAVVLAGLPFQVHWNFVKPDLERALETGTCPDRAGLSKVHYCSTVVGERAFNFGTGFIDQSYVLRTTVEPVANGPDQLVRVKKIDTDWYVVVREF